MSKFAGFYVPTAHLLRQFFIGGEYLHCECAHANTRRCTEKQAFGGLDAQTAVKRRDGGGSTCQVMDQKIGGFGR
jgi:hypothetical protein